MGTTDPNPNTPSIIKAYATTEVATVKADAVSFFAKVKAYVVANWQYFWPSFIAGVVSTLVVRHFI